MEKKIWMGLTVLVLLLMGTSFAWWYWNSTTNTNITLTINGVDVTYVGGSDITGVNLIPVSSKEIGLSKNSAIEKVVTASSTATMYMNLYLTLETLPDGLKDKSFVYEVYNGANLVGKGNFASYNQGDKVQIASAQTITSSETSFQVYIWIAGNVDNPSGMMNQTFKFVLSADASDNIPSQQTLTKLGVSSINTLTPDFSKVPYITKEQAQSDMTTFCDLHYYESDLTSCISFFYHASTFDEVWATGYVSAVDDNGIFEAQDDLGTSYYYRGNVENNYVYFANAYWRIIRINGDGTIRMIYDGPTKKHNGVYGTDNKVTDVKYNENRDDNAYVGYMYGTPTSDYTNTHKNTTSSTIKQTVDKWYEDTIIAGGYDKYIADAIYCNDRKVETGTLYGDSYSGTGISKEASLYAPTNRVISLTPTLKCSQDNDKFSTTALGNGDLTYPVGLITIDEAIMAGTASTYYGPETEYPSGYSYLTMGAWYWTMSPSYFSGAYAVAWYVFFGLAYDGNANFPDGLRPVVSLKSDTTFSGNGSYEQPFTIS